jgi:WD40 repeat protein
VVRQFLDEVGDERGKGPYALFHGSLRDYLLDNERNQDFWCAPQDGHRSIANHYLVDHDRRWSAMDLYGLRHLPTHLMGAAQWADLTELLCDLAFIEAKCAAGMTYDLVADYDRAGARWLKPGPPIRTVWRDEGIAGIHCPFCDTWSRIGKEQLDQVVVCSVCERQSKATPFSLKANWPHSTASRARKPVRESAEGPLEGVSQFAHFVQSQAHILAELPALTLQQAANQPDPWAPARAARVLWESGAESRPWLLWVNKPQELEARLMTLPGRSVLSCAFAPDGRRIVAQSNYSTFKVWDAETGQEVATLEGIPGMTWDVESLSAMSLDEFWAMQLYGCAYSPDGRFIVTGGREYAVTVWDAETGQVVATLEGHTDRIRACAYTPDGQYVVSASEDGTLKVWYAATGEGRVTLKGHQDKVTSCAFSPDGRRIVSGSWDNTLKVWKSKGGKAVATLAGHSDHVMACAYSPDGRWILSASSDHTLKLWEATTGQEVATQEGHSDRVMACAFSPDGQRIVSVSDDHTVKLWDGGTGQELVSLEAFPHEVTSCAYSPDGRRIVTGSLHGPLKLWDVRRMEAMADTGGRPVYALHLRSVDEQPTTMHSQFLKAYAVAPDRSRLTTGSEDGILSLADATTGKGISTRQAHQAGVLACAYSPDGRRIVSASGDGTCKLWDARSLRELATLTGHSEYVGACAFSPDGRRLLSGSGDQTLKVWDAESGEELATLVGHSGPITDSRFSPDGHRIVSASADYTVRIWDANTFTDLAVLEAHTDSVYALAYAPDGRQIVSESWDGSQGTATLRLWDARMRIEVATLEAHTGSIDALAYSPDGLHILSGSEDGTLRVWDSRTGEQMSMFFLDEGVACLGQNKDGSVVTAFDAEGRPYVLSLEGFDRGEPVVQAAHLYHFGRHRWEAKASTRCAWCAGQISVPAPVMHAIQLLAGSVALEPGQCPTEALPDDAYEDPSLVADCPRCQRPLRFNPFIVDSLERMEQKRPWWGFRW